MPFNILIAPLNWGLGHATRCIPLIRAALHVDAHVILASDGRSYQLLKEEFPNLLLIALPAYDVRYDSDNMVVSMGKQLPKVLRAMYAEHRMLKQIIQQHNIDLVISDNRYGLFNRKVKCIFLTHQINLLIPNPLLQWYTRRSLRFWINTFFDECWVPDVADSPNISGKLSHGVAMKAIKYIGVLSRMQQYETIRKYDLVVVLSGPEPQRTKLEEKVIAQTRTLDKKILIVGGKPESQERKMISANVEYVAFMNTKDLKEAMLASDVVMSRSGYSTLMDLVKIGKQAILIPTPGQTEQEYLADHFMEAGIFFSVAQEELNLVEAIKKASQYSGFPTDYVHAKDQQLMKLIRSIVP